MVWNHIIIKQMDNYLIKLFLTKWSYSLVQSVVGANCKRTQNISLSQFLTPSLELKLQGALVLNPPPTPPTRVSILSIKYSWIQMTQTFLKKVWVIGSMKQMTRNKKEIKWMDGERMQVSRTLHVKGSKRNKYFEKKIKQQSLINIQGWTLNLNWSDIKVKTKNWPCYL